MSRASASGSGYKPWLRRGGGGRGGRGAGNAANARKRAFMAKTDSDDPNHTSEPFQVKVDPGCPYKSFKLYFPSKKFSEPSELNHKIKTITKHFVDFLHWYDINKIIESFSFELPMENIACDGIFTKAWPNWYQDMTENPVETFLLIGLAMHTIIEKKFENSNPSILLRKLYVRPLGWRPVSRISSIINTTGTLVSTAAIVKNTKQITCSYKFIAYECERCSTQLFIQQKSSDDKRFSQNIAQPFKCLKQCKGPFNQLLSSPYTIYSPSQRIIIQDICYISDDDNPSLEVILTGDQVMSLVVGYHVVLTGYIRLVASTSIKEEGKIYKPVFKCCSVVTREGKNSLPYELKSDRVQEMITCLKSDPRVFKLLAYSLCPSVYGREEAKAAVILALLSGNDLILKRRSNCHVMLIGNPGTGKSTFLMNAAKISYRGMFVCGATSTQAGLTAGIVGEGEINAGALVLTNNGVCCIDEVDKFPFPYYVLLEVMEQQKVSIAKCGAVANLPGKCSVIAATNPIGGVYDRNKTLLQNVKFHDSFVSRFDLIIPLAENVQPQSKQYTDHLFNMSKTERTEYNFFDSSTSADENNRTKSHHWLKVEADEHIKPLTLDCLRSYIECARQNVFPKLEPEARRILYEFTLEYTNLLKSCGLSHNWGISRQAEALIRLSTARARAEMADIVTVEHAYQIIELFKYSQIDAYSNYDGGTSSYEEPKFFGEIPARRRKIENIATMSKPKQMKAFYEHLKDKSRSEERQIFLNSEVKEMAKELCIAEYDDIIYRLNNDGFILKTADGYRVLFE